METSDTSTERSPGLFVFTAANQDAQKHLKDTIENPVPRETIEEYIDATQFVLLDEAAKGEFYCWGATPGKRNVPTWESIEPGDDVLAYFDKAYHFSSKVVFKTRNEKLAKKLWGSMPDGSTWEYIYFLTRPDPIVPPLSSEVTSDWLQSMFQGFSRVSEEKVNALRNKFGSLDGFIQDGAMVRKDDSHAGLLTVVVEAIGTAKAKDLLAEDGFRLQLGRDKLLELEAIDLPTAQLEELSKELEANADKDFLTILRDYVPEDPKGRLLRTMGELVAYCDTNAAGKLQFNQYPDKRVMARTGVRQNVWIDNLLAYVREGNSMGAISAPSIRYALSYLKDPTNEVSITSQGHRTMIAERLFKRPFVEEEFTAEMKRFFEPYGVVAKDERNLTAVMGHVLYADGVKELWFGVGGLICVDSGTWFKDALADFNSKGRIALWWSELPSYGKQTVQQLSEAIRRDGYFELYYTRERKAHHRARIIDFAFADNYAGKNWNQQGAVAWLERSFSDYKGDSPNGTAQQAKVVFLVDAFEPVDPPISANDFKFVKSSKGLTQSNLLPYVSVEGAPEWGEVHKNQAPPRASTTPTQMREEFMEYLRNHVQVAPKSILSYLSSMNRLQDWFVEQNATGPGFNIWLDHAKVSDINDQLDGPVHSAWTEVNKKRNNSLRAPWNHWSRFLAARRSSDTSDTRTKLLHPTAKELIAHVHSYIIGKGYRFRKEEVANFYLALRTKPFVILAGISGTGKTQLPSLFARATGMEDHQVIQVAVRPDWTDGGDLIGYVGLDDEFKPKDLTLAIQRAKGDPDRPYFFILDEMNLARVEHYFSDFLSVIESRERRDDGRIVTRPLLREESIASATNRDEFEGLSWPSNLYLVGTVNMDETTHAFSRKVLDRANSIEMNDVDLSWPKNEEPVTAWSGIHSDALLTKYLIAKELTDADKESLKKEKVIEFMTQVNDILRHADLHFAYRVRDEMAFYLVLNMEFGLMEHEEAVDFQLMQKVLPRIHGSSIRTERVLLDLLGLLSGIETAGNDHQTKDLEQTVKETANVRYKRSVDKILFMLRRFEEDRFTSFWL